MKIGILGWGAVCTAPDSGFITPGVTGTVTIFCSKNKCCIQLVVNGSTANGLSLWGIARSETTHCGLIPVDPCLVNCKR